MLTYWELLYIILDIRSIALGTILRLVDLVGFTD